MGKQSVALEKFLGTQASDPNYIAALDSYLYNRGIPRGPDKLKFFITTVKLQPNGSYANVPYFINGQTLVGIVLLINPTSLSLNLSKMINRTQTMTGWIEDHWGEELDTITFQGSSASFLWGGPWAEVPEGPLDQSPQEIQKMFNDYMDLPDLGVEEPVGLGDHSGLTAKRRRETLSYDEFRKITQLMNANGAKFDMQGLVKERLFIQLSYDYSCYRGYFESVDITEDSTTPFKFIYTITFKSEQTIYSFLR